MRSFQELTDRVHRLEALTGEAERRVREHQAAGVMVSETDLDELSSAIDAIGVRVQALAPSVPAVVDPTPTDVPVAAPVDPTPTDVPVAAPVDPTAPVA